MPDNLPKSSATQGGRSERSSSPQNPLQKRLGPGPMEPQPPFYPQAPSALLRRWSEDMTRLIEDLNPMRGFSMPGIASRDREGLMREAARFPAAWSPRVEVVEREDGLLVRADLPGLGRDDIKVWVGDSFLTIEGEREDVEEQSGEGRYYSECSYGHFYRSIPLPDGADASGAVAKCRDGVLEVSIPTPGRCATQARRLEIQ